MFKTSNKDTSSKSISFPNPSRSYDEARHGVHFWGYDRTFEIAFFIEESALSKVDPQMNTDEDGLLQAFDVNRDQIYAIAGNLFSRGRKTQHPPSYTLTDLDI